MKKFSFVRLIMPVLVMLIFVLFSSMGGDEKQSDTLDWKMGLQNVKTKEMVPFSAPVQSRTGEKFRLVIKPEANCYCYIVAESSNNDEIGILYSGKLEGGKDWLSSELELSPPRGSESIFVITSKAEQTALSQLISAYKSNSGPTQRRALMNEVFRIRSEVSLLKEVPEKPVLMGGSARGAPGNNEGVEFSGLGTYVKTISLNH